MSRYIEVFQVYEGSNGEATITDEEAEELRTVGDVHALVERKVAERAPA